MKLTDEKRRELARLHDEGLSSPKIAERLGISPSRASALASLYGEKGIEAILHPQGGRRATPEEKLAIVNAVAKGRTPRSLSHETGFSAVTISNWVKRHASMGYNGLLNRKGGRHGKKRKAEEGQDGGVGKGEQGAEEAERGSQEKEQGAGGEVRGKKNPSLTPESGHREKREAARRIWELRQKGDGRRLSIMLDEAKLNRKTYYYYVKKLAKPDKDYEIVTEITRIFDESDATYGYPRVALELRNRGFTVNHKKVARIMREGGLRARQGKSRSRYSSYRGTYGKIADNLLLVKKTLKGGKVVTGRNFKFSMPLQALATDVTEFKLPSGDKVYLAPVMDLCTQEILSFSLSRSPDMKQQTDMLAGLFGRCKEGSLRNTIFHSDQGWQYQHKTFSRMLEEHGMRQSMSRKGNCHDNAVMENFFGRLKNECFYGREETFGTADSLMEAVKAYIGRYNNKRIQKRLGGMSPAGYRHKLEPMVN